jgi:hypothetical protein
MDVCSGVRWCCLTAWSRNRNPIIEREHRLPFLFACTQDKQRKGLEHCCDGKGRRLSRACPSRHRRTIAVLSLRSPLLRIPRSFHCLRLVKPCCPSITLHKPQNFKLVTTGALLFLPRRLLGDSYALAPRRLFLYRPKSLPREDVIRRPGPCSAVPRIQLPRRKAVRRDLR